MTTQINPATQIANGTLPAGVIATNATNAVSLNGIGTAANFNADFASIAGSPSQAFSVGNAATASQAVALGQANGLYQPARTPNVTPVQNGTGILVSANHTLGYVPFFVSFEYVNLAAEQGFSVGDVAECISQWNGTVNSTLQVYKTSTLVGVQTVAGYTPQLSAKSGGAAFTPTAANWAYRFSVR